MSSRRNSRGPGRSPSLSPGPRSSPSLSPGPRSSPSRSLVEQTPTGVASSRPSRHFNTSQSVYSRSPGARRRSSLIPTLRVPLPTPGVAEELLTSTHSDVYRRPSISSNAVPHQEHLRAEGELYLITSTTGPHKRKSPNWVVCEDNRLSVYSTWSTAGRLLYEMSFERVHVVFNFSHAHRHKDNSLGAPPTRMQVIFPSSSSQAGIPSKGASNMPLHGTFVPAVPKSQDHYYYFGVEGLARDLTSGANRRSLCLFCTDRHSDYELWMEFWADMAMRYPMVQTRAAADPSNSSLSLDSGAGYTPWGETYAFHSPSDSSPPLSPRESPSEMGPGDDRASVRDDEAAAPDDSIMECVHTGSPRGLVLGVQATSRLEYVEGLEADLRQAVMITEDDLWRWIQPSAPLAVSKAELDEAVPTITVLQAGMELLTREASSVAPPADTGFTSISHSPLSIAPLADSRSGHETGRIALPDAAENLHSYQAELAALRAENELLQQQLAKRNTQAAQLLHCQAWQPHAEHTNQLEQSTLTPEEAEVSLPIETTLHRRHPHVRNLAPVAVRQVTSDALGTCGRVETLPPLLTQDEMRLSSSCSPHCRSFPESQRSRSDEAPPLLRQTLESMVRVFAPYATEVPKCEESDAIGRWLRAIEAVLATCEQTLCEAAAQLIGEVQASTADVAVCFRDSQEVRRYLQRLDGETTCDPFITSGEASVWSTATAAGTSSLGDDGATMAAASSAASSTAGDCLRRLGHRIADTKAEHATLLAETESLRLALMQLVGCALPTSSGEIGERFDAAAVLYGWRADRNYSSAAVKPQSLTAKGSGEWRSTVYTAAALLAAGQASLGARSIAQVKDQLAALPQPRCFFQGTATAASTSGEEAEGDRLLSGYPLSNRSPRESTGGHQPLPPNNIAAMTAASAAALRACRAEVDNLYGILYALTHPTDPSSAVTTSIGEETSIPSWSHISRTPADLAAIRREECDLERQLWQAQTHYSAQRANRGPGTLSGSTELGDGSQGTPPDADFAAFGKENADALLSLQGKLDDVHAAIHGIIHHPSPSTVPVVREHPLVAMTAAAVLQDSRMVLSTSEEAALTALLSHPHPEMASHADSVLHSSKEDMEERHDPAVEATRRWLKTLSQLLLRPPFDMQLQLLGEAAPATLAAFRIAYTPCQQGQSFPPPATEPQGSAEDGQLAHVAAVEVIDVAEEAILASTTDLVHDHDLHSTETTLTQLEAAFTADYHTPRSQQDVDPTTWPRQLMTASHAGMAQLDSVASTPETSKHLQEIDTERHSLAIATQQPLQIDLSRLQISAAASVHLPAGQEQTSADSSTIESAQAEAADTSQLRQHATLRCLSTTSAASIDGDHPSQLHQSLKDVEGMDHHWAEMTSFQREPKHESEELRAADEEAEHLPAGRERNAALRRAARLRSELGDLETELAAAEAAAAGAPDFDAQAVTPECVAAVEKRLRAVAALDDRLAPSGKGKRLSATYCSSSDSASECLGGSGGEVLIAAGGCDGAAVEDVLQMSETINRVCCILSGDDGLAEVTLDAACARLVAVTEETRDSVEAAYANFAGSESGLNASEKLRLSLMVDMMKDKWKTLSETQRTSDVILNTFDASVAAATESFASVNLRFCSNTRRLCPKGKPATAEETRMNPLLGARLLFEKHRTRAQYPRCITMTLGDVPTSEQGVEEKRMDLEILCRAAVVSLEMMGDVSDHSESSPALLALHLVLLAKDVQESQEVSEALLAELPEGGGSSAVTDKGSMLRSTNAALVSAVRTYRGKMEAAQQSNTYLLKQQRFLINESEDAEVLRTELANALGATQAAQRACLAAVEESRATAASLETARSQLTESLATIAQLGRDLDEAKERGALDCAAANAELTAALQATEALRTEVGRLQMELAATREEAQSSAALRAEADTTRAACQHLRDQCQRVRLVARRVLSRGMVDDDDDCGGKLNFLQEAPAADGRVAADGILRDCERMVDDTLDNLLMVTQELRDSQEAVRDAHLDLGHATQQLSAEVAMRFQQLQEDMSRHQMVTERQLQMASEEAAAEARDLQQGSAQLRDALVALERSVREAQGRENAAMAAAQSMKVEAERARLREQMQRLQQAEGQMVTVSAIDHWTSAWITPCATAGGSDTPIHADQLQAAATQEQRAVLERAERSLVDMAHMLDTVVAAHPSIAATACLTPANLPAKLTAVLAHYEARIDEAQKLLQRRCSKTTTSVGTTTGPDLLLETVLQAMESPQDARSHRRFSSFPTLQERAQAAADALHTATAQGRALDSAKVHLAALTGGSPTDSVTVLLAAAEAALTAARKESTNHLGLWQKAAHDAEVARQTLLVRDNEHQQVVSELEIHIGKMRERVHRKLEADEVAVRHATEVQRAMEHHLRQLCSYATERADMMLHVHRLRQLLKERSWGAAVCAA